MITRRRQQRRTLGFDLWQGPAHHAWRAETASPHGEPGTVLRASLYDSRPSCGWRVRLNRGGRETISPLRTCLIAEYYCRILQPGCRVNQLVLAVSYVAFPATHWIELSEIGWNEVEARAIRE